MRHYELCGSLEVELDQTTSGRLLLYHTRALTLHHILHETRKPYHKRVNGTYGPYGGVAMICTLVISYIIISH